MRNRTSNGAPRRVLPDEVRQRTGWGDTWLRLQYERGKFPRPHYDPGGRRRWWPDAEVDAAIVALNEAGSHTPKLDGAARGASIKTLGRPVAVPKTAANTTATTARKQAVPRTTKATA